MTQRKRQPVNGAEPQRHVRSREQLMAGLVEPTGTAIADPGSFHRFVATVRLLEVLVDIRDLLLLVVAAPSEEEAKHG